MSRVTLKTIAQKANLSVSTVSLALRGQGSLDPRTVGRVKTIAKELDYVPNPVLASLASRRFRANQHSRGAPLAILEFPTTGVPGTPPPEHYPQPLAESAKMLGFSPQRVDYREMRNATSALRSLYNRGVQGIVVSGQAPPGFFDAQEDWHRFSLVQCGRYLTESPLHTVRPNVFQSIKLAFNELHELGYRRIGYAICSHDPVIEDDEARLGAIQALQTLHEKRGERVPPYRGAIRDTEALLAWMDKNKPDVLVGFSEAHGFMLNDAGYRFPDDIGFASLHINAQSGFPCAGLDQESAEIARQAVFLLDQLIRHNERGLPEAPRQTLISSKWINGPTVRQVKK